MLTAEPLIIESYVRTGQVKLVFRDVLNHGERSERASEAAACAGRQGQFWQLHAILFENQSMTWATGNEGLVELMVGFAAQLEGFDQAAFAQCMADRSTLPALQAADAEQRTRGITIQPIVEIGEQRIIGAQAFEVYAAAIEAVQ